MFSIELPQPWAHLLISGQVNCLPGLLVKPPREACGTRLNVIAKGVDWTAAQSLLSRYGFEYPDGKKYQPDTCSLWRQDNNGQRGSFKTQRHGRRWMKNPKYGISTELVVGFPAGELGSVQLSGWLIWENCNSSKPTGQYKAGKDQRSMKLHKIASGPICWVLRRPNLKTKKSEQTLRPMGIR